MMARMPATAILDTREPRDASTGPVSRPGVVLVTRRRRVAAVTLDLAVLAGFAAIASLLALVWMLARTEAGRYDLAIGDSTLAFALVLTAVPAWAALLAVDIAVFSATPGQRRMGLAVEGGTRRQFLRFAFHPVGVIVWCWLAVAANLATLPVAGLVFLAVAMTDLLGAVASVILAFRSPSARGAHDIMAGTRLVAR